MAVGVSDDGELNGGVGGFVDVLDPAVVGGEVVGTLMNRSASYFSTVVERR
jgi:hypothetical protein